jgi:hypothetical protein
MSPCADSNAPFGGVLYYVELGHGAFFFTHSLRCTHPTYSGTVHICDHIRSAEVTLLDQSTDRYFGIGVDELDHGDSRERHLTFLCK